jgi:hypothetical protein
MRPNLRWFGPSPAAFGRTANSLGDTQLGLNMKVFRILAAALSIFIAASPAHAGSPSPAPEQAVVVHFNYGSRDLRRLFALEEKLEAAITAANAGEYDGNEIATSGKDGILYMYGPDADRLFSVILPVLKSSAFMRGAEVTKRYGPPKSGVREVHLLIEP